MFCKLKEVPLLVDMFCCYCFMVDALGNDTHRLETAGSDKVSIVLVILEM